MIFNINPKELLVLSLIIITVPSLVGSEESAIGNNQWSLWNNSNTSSISPDSLIIIIVAVVIGILIWVYFIRKHDRAKNLSQVQPIVPTIKQKTEKPKEIKDESEDIIKISKVRKIPYSVDKELNELRTKRAEIEEIVRIAKIRYYKRKLDEESYKEIVKDNQEKLIKIEADIGKIRKRIKQLKSNIEKGE